MAKSSKRRRNQKLIDRRAVGFLNEASQKHTLKGIELPPLDQEKCVSVSLKYFHKSHQCFSDWQKVELKAFSNFIDKLRKRKWQDVVATGGSLGVKTGLGYTKHQCATAREKFQWEISEDIEFCELRVNEKARIHGFQIDSIFYACWLDKNHKFLK